MRRQFSVRLKVTTDRRIEAVMAQFPMSKSHVINELIDLGLDQAEQAWETLDEYLK